MLSPPYGQTVAGIDSPDHTEDNGTRIARP